eukprot:118610_1
MATIDDAKPKDNLPIQITTKNEIHEISNPDIVEMQQDERSLSLSVSESDTCDEQEPKGAPNLRLEDITTDYTIQNTPTVTVVAIPTNPPVPTAIKSTSMTHSTGSEDDYRTVNDIASQLQLDQDCAAIRKDLNANYIKYKWHKFVTKPLVCSRVFALILTIILLIVSVTYCIAQPIHVELDLLTECPDVKTREQIWAHYEQRSLQSNAPGKLTKETQHGATGDNCWTTKPFELNLDALFYSNQYKHQWKENATDAKMILFGLMSMYCVLIMVYNTVSIIYDVMDVHKDTLHTRSQLYEAQQTTAVKIHKEPCFGQMRKWYDEYLAMDTTGWVIVMLIHECMEILLQSSALLMYNGYYILDPRSEKDVYLANKPEYIVAFASILAFNCFGSGLCWLLYSLAHRTCHGLVFKFSIFFVDQFSDLLYTVFPFIIVFTDSYNHNTENAFILLGQLNVDSGLAFIAAFIPLLFLCNKCLLITINSVHSLRDEYYNAWKFIQDIVRQPNHQLIVYAAQTRGLKIDSIIQKEIYDGNGNIMLDIKQVVGYQIKNIIRQVSLVIIALAYIGWGIVVLVFSIYYLYQSEQYCARIQEDRFFDGNGRLKANITLGNQELRLLDTNPELFVWQHCLYPVYPFASDQYKCQCRVFVIDWSADFASNVEDRHGYLNITQHMILHGILTNWIMLEKFKTVGTETEWFAIGDNIITSEMFKARKLKAFEWRNAQINDFEEGIGGWSELEYFRLDQTSTIRRLPSDFEYLKKMRYFRAEYSGLLEFPEQLCALKDLFGIHIEWAAIPSIPHCISNLSNLEIIIFNGLVDLTNVPIALFSLPHLRELSLWKAAITYENLLAFNNISNDFSERFNWNASAEYYISLNGICDQTIRYALPSKLQEFMNETNACHYPCSPDPQTAFMSAFCPPNVFGDGRCDFGCNWYLCEYDGGDCVQLCFATAFSDCTWDLFTNEVCDAECDNEYCVGYKWGSAFQTVNAVDKNGEWFVGDNHWCLINNRTDNEHETYQSTSNVSCWDSHIDNEYKDVHFDQTEIVLPECREWWIGDGLCDDACRTDSCLYDNGDCELHCLDDTCHLMFTLWSYLNPTNADLLASATVCSDQWITVQSLFQIDESLNCTQLLIDVDYNADKHINFREFVVIALGVYYSADGVWEWQKAPQVNCSSCVGMLHYNPIYPFK